MIICVANQKGGCGKTATSLAVSTILAKRGNKVLVIDMDPQANLTSQMSVDAGDKDTYALLMRTISLQDAITTATFDGGLTVDIVPSSYQLSSFEVLSDIDKPFRLKEAIGSCPSAQDYDYIIIDTPPALGNISVNALIAADVCLIPTEPNMDTLYGIWEIGNNIEQVKTYFNKKLRVVGILFTMFDKRQINSRNMYELAGEIARRLDTSVFTTKVRRAVAVADSKVRAENLFTNAAVPVVQDYEACVDELLERIEEGK